MDFISSGDLLAKGLECTASPLSRRRFENCCCDDCTHVCIYVTELDNSIYIHTYGHLSKHNEHMIATECKYVGKYLAWPIVTDKIFAETKNCTNILLLTTNNPRDY